MTTTNGGETATRHEPALNIEQAVRFAVFRAVFSHSQTYPAVEQQVTRFSELILGSRPSLPAESPRTT